MYTKHLPKYPPPFIIKAFDKFRYFLIKFSRKFTAPNIAIVEMVQSFYVSKAIGVAAELNIAEHLKKHDRNIYELANLTNTNEESLYRLMRMLASQGIFKEKNNRIFSQNRLSKTITDCTESMRYMIMHLANPINWQLFNELNHVVKTGDNASEKVLGMKVFEFLEKNPANNKIYNTAMTNSSLMLSYAILSKYRFKKAGSIIDIGGGEGILLTMILIKNPSLKGLLFDLPHVIKNAKENFRKYNLSDRVKLMPGSFYEKIPKGGDIYLMKNIIHNLSDQQAIDILIKINNVLPQKGKILIIEPVISHKNRYSFAKLFDIQMMVSQDGGKERTKKEYCQLIHQAGLNLNQIISTVAPFSIIEITK
ncbi:MAG TPA: methyltransferase [Bacteroidales bacterium]|nr:methyltransferase [Bacteroidales bacterium]